MSNESNEDNESVHLPTPTFVSIDKDGDLNLEWCFGQQGADDSYRVSMFVSGEYVDGYPMPSYSLLVTIVRTTKRDQQYYDSRSLTATELYEKLTVWLGRIPIW